MNREQLEHIINNHFKKLKKHSRNIPGDFDLEAIHQFRVEYKKLRAFFRLLSQAPEIKKEIKIAKKLKKLYTLAGVLRSYQLQVQWVRLSTRTNLKKPFEYNYLLHRRMNKLKPKLLRSLSRNPVKKGKKKVFTSLPQECSLPGIHTYAEDCLYNVRAIILADQLFDDNIHTIRKILKDILYNGKIYSKEEKGQKLEVRSSTHAQYLEQLPDELGRFQDKCTAIELMKPSWLKKMDEGQRQQLERIKSVWVEEKAAMRKMLVARFKSDLILVHFAPKQHPAESGNENCS